MITTIEISYVKGLNSGLIDPELGMIQANLGLESSRNFLPLPYRTEFYLPDGADAERFIDAIESIESVEITEVNQEYRGPIKIVLSKKVG